MTRIAAFFIVPIMEAITVFVKYGKLRYHSGSKRAKGKTLGEFNENSRPSAAQNHDFGDHLTILPQSLQ
jgi:hypothetical protein